MTQTQWFPVAGVKLAAIEAGIKKANRKDLVVIELAEGSRTAGVFTTNRFQAAPVQVARRNLKESAPRYLMINTGYANAGTGDKGFAYCEETCLLLSELAHCAPSEVLPFSTGVIGQAFPMKPFEEGLPRALESLDEHGWGRAAEGIMTTDTVPKVASRRIELDGETVTLTGMAKGAGMIKPNMATMLGFIATDAGVAQPLLDRWLKSLADVSFNRITVDGDTSTNDACVLIASGRSGVTIEDGDSRSAAMLYEALEAVFVELAQALIRDAEGASKFVSIQVSGADSDRDAQVVAETIGHSPLVKTALFASDPNWGRILAAVGRAPIERLDVRKVSVWLDDVRIVAEGGVADSYTEEQGARVMARPDITIRVDLGTGQGQGQVWTCDFSYDYVKINAEYRT
ncbi:bifunctional glutamate N-acetyltransferase/amino-acid acetyltransferase ArgJ [Alloalcanivorax gelatiniphagus]|uniref:Arginine biosynthesis bifunctional protein ArgJ n=1 Tax=Alloalcanivorax gelatiniphagus TaxID=1194167 RepID=A0ABY2XFY1_9GAMM|nr:bifunctional glutamate N-acetyltransferase/amino-acid acetyltransferase ArgJ [Alloalcanivorax gelatiniphagus]TMW10505.1 bifunctional glutamate N-acetyltransferase/amino-acid acetyltransferase ArgJ [Alloalcanivorax gelatiniphagus]|tara:strand:+ start:1257 stop:2459 length:1203 start_codon:yes stop_codon:yes gene_type:complete